MEQADSWVMVPVPDWMVPQVRQHVLTLAFRQHQAKWDSASVAEHLRSLDPQPLAVLSLVAERIAAGRSMGEQELCQLLRVSRPELLGLIAAANDVSAGPGAIVYSRVPEQDEGETRGRRLYMLADIARIICEQMVELKLPRLPTTVANVLIRRRVRISFVCPSQPLPMGGVTAIYEFANGLARRGHQVHIAHGRFWGRGITSLDEIAWFDFEPEIQHHLDPGSGVDLPDGDIIFGTEAPRRMGLPVLLVQGLDMFPKEIEHQAFLTPGLKVCVASWLIDAGLELGVPREQLVHVPMGIDHSLFRVRTPIEDRAPCVGLLHNEHPAKGWRAGLAALELVHQRVPEAEAIVFSQQLPRDPLPAWIEAVEARSQTQLAEEVYDRCSVFLQSSVWEGFGFTAIEAMACGCALVTTDNGGSRDYAVHGRTALVSPPKDEVALADSLERLLTDDAWRTGLAQAGGAHVRFQFDWNRAGGLLEEHLQAYLAEPERYMQPAAP